MYKILKCCHREEAPRRCYLAPFPSSQFIKTTFTHFTSSFCFCLVCVGSLGKPVWPLWPFSVANDKPLITKGHDYPV